MKQPINKQWNLPFDLCRVAKTLGVMVAIFAALGLFIFVAATFPKQMIIALFAILIGLAVTVIGAIVYEVVGPC